MAEDVTESTEMVDTPEPSVEVTEEPAGEAYTVSVDGESQEVSLQELRDGYQRQADYTRKTQELASERKRLQQAEAIASALENDPEATLKVTHSGYKHREYLKRQMMTVGTQTMLPRNVSKIWRPKSRSKIVYAGNKLLRSKLRI